jgi:hypothetical protein
MPGIGHARHKDLACDVRCAFGAHVQARVRFNNVTLTESEYPNE